MTTLRELRLTDRIAARFASRKALLAVDDEEGMSTVEYAIGIVGAGCAAGVLIKFLQSAAFHDLLKSIITGVLKKLVPIF